MTEPTPTKTGQLLVDLDKIVSGLEDLAALPCGAETSYWRNNQRGQSHAYGLAARMLGSALVLQAAESGEGGEPLPWDELGYDRALSRWILQAHYGLHERTANLVRTFAFALAEKLKSAERKYGCSDGWARSDWEAECQAHLLAHVAKGDPLDVAAYAAFCWHHQWSTSPDAPLPSQPFEELQGERDRLRAGLKAAAERFREYEASHAAKGNLDGDAKARRNAEMAEMCERLALQERG